MTIPLEDDFADIIGKARHGLGLHPCRCRMLPPRMPRRRDTECGAVATAVLCRLGADREW
jgi:hypothetical protein